MPFTRPALGDLVTRIRADIRGRLSIAGPLLRRAMVDVVGAVEAGGMHELYGYLDWLSKQLFATTAERDALLRMALPYGFSLVPAAFATGTFTATGVDGSPILADTIIRLDETTSYRVTTGQVIAGGTAAVPITAVLAGASANVPAGTTLTFESPIAGVNATGVTAADIEDGADEEDIEHFRTRFLLRKRKPPEGGADQDYELWALAVPGVTRVWVYPNELGLGTVVVRFVRDGDVSIFPDGGAVAAVQAAIMAKRPIASAPTTMAPTNHAVAFTIAITPSNADTKAAVTAELTDLFARVAEPGDISGRGTALLSQLRTAIGNAEGVTDYVLTVPAANVVPGVGELLTLGAITWV